MKLKHILTLLGVSFSLAAVGAVGVAAGEKWAEKDENLVAEVNAATETTVYYAISSQDRNSYTVKLNVNRQGDADNWAQYTMSDTGNDYDGKDVFSYTFTDLYDGLGKLQFQLYDGSTWKSQVEPVSSWTSASVYNGKLWVHGGSSWLDYGTTEVENVTLSVTFSTAVPSYAMIYIPGTLDTWTVAASNRMTANNDRTVFSITFASLNVGNYEYKIVADYASNASSPLWTHEITTGDNKSVSITASYADKTTNLLTGLVCELSEETIADGANLKVTFSSAVPAGIDVYMTSSLFGWNETKNNTKKFTPNAGRTVFTLVFPEGTHTGSIEYTLVAMSSRDSSETILYTHKMYPANGNASLTLNTSTVNYEVDYGEAESLSYDFNDVKALYFSQGFLGDMAGVCTDQNADNKSGVEGIWSTWDSEFDGMTSGQQDAFKSVSTHTEVVRARKLYNHVLTRYSLTAWDAAQENANIGVNENVNSNNSFAIIVLVSVSAVALGGVVVIRKRKQEN